MTTRRLSLGLLICLACGTILAPSIQGQEILFDGSTFRVIDWEDISDANELSSEDQARLLTVYVDVPGGNPSPELPAVSGAYRIEGEALVFGPRYPPAPGVSYRVVFDPEAIGLLGSRSVASFDVAQPETPPTVVEHVYPSTDVLPENQLKLYIHFSAPMSRGEAYRHLRLLDANGEEVELAFLELEQELWTRDFRRFTVLFDPGRIKSGLVPNLQFGRALVAGNTYTLLVGREWRDGNGRPLDHEYRKTFRAGPFDDIAPSLSTWHLDVPEAETQAPVAVEFPEPLDRGLMDRLLVIVDPAGSTLQGSIAVDREETRWLFTPDNPWTPGDYEVVVGTELEDLAGNALNGLFEVDIFDVDEAGDVDATVSLSFTIPSQQ